MNLLIQYYEGRIPSLAEEGKEEKQIATLTEDEDVGLLEEVISPKSNLPPLLLKLSERPAEQLDYLGVSYGLTGQLLRYIACILFVYETTWDWDKFTKSRRWIKILQAHFYRVGARPNRSNIVE